MIRPWQEIVAYYEGFEGEQRSIRALAALARRITDGPLANGLFAWTSMLDLCIVQTDVSYPYDGPLLRLSPVSNDQIEFRYVDTVDKAKQWHRTVHAAQALPRLIKFLDELRWFPASVLEPLRSNGG